MARRQAVVAPWGKRIVGHADVPARDFLANEANFRIHPKGQQDALAGLLNEVGFVQSVIVNKRTAPAWGRNRGVETLIDGHARVELALSRDEETLVPVVYVDLTPREERRVLLTLDKVSAMAGDDADKLDALFEESVKDYPESDVDLQAILRRERRHVAFEAGTACSVLVTCADAEAQEQLMRRLTSEGYGCKATTRR